MTMTYTPTVDPCDKCHGSADGCTARQAARAGRCCHRCTHPDEADGADDADHHLRCGGDPAPGGAETPPSAAFLPGI